MNFRYRDVLRRICRDGFERNYVAEPSRLERAYHFAKTSAEVGIKIAAFTALVVGAGYIAFTANNYRWGGSHAPKAIEAKVENANVANFGELK